MNTFKKILTSFVIALSLAAASLNTSAVVANPFYEDVKAAIDNSLTKVEEAKTALDSGADKAELIDMVTQFAGYPSFVKEGKK